MKSMVIAVGLFSWLVQPAPTPKQMQGPPFPTWPDTLPDPPGGVSAMGDGYHQYKKSEVSPGHWQWVINVEAEKRAADEQKKRSDLFISLQRRILTDDEYTQATAYGRYLNIWNGQSYRDEDKQRELNEAFAQQARLRVIAGMKVAP